MGNDCRLNLKCIPRLMFEGLIPSWWLYLGMFKKQETMLSCRKWVSGGRSLGVYIPGCFSFRSQLPDLLGYEMNYPAIPSQMSPLKPRGQTNCPSFTLFCWVFCHSGDRLTDTTETTHLYVGETLVNPDSTDPGGPSDYFCELLFMS